MLKVISFSLMISSEKLEKKIYYFQLLNYSVNVHKNPHLDETHPKKRLRGRLKKDLHPKEMHSTWFGDDVIRFAPAARRPNRCSNFEGRSTVP